MSYSVHFSFFTLFRDFLIFQVVKFFSPYSRSYSGQF
ncbi:hypothetical protein T02_3007 [Trichinella nativa]|uniref:Uncharacterized protein n=1 Tax=Trichinella nativa TaxID=6335 RepID=A0A0V1KIH9_9BILA|nr:hypothetical protein T02_3007 [Trichinella nativa]